MLDVAAAREGFLDKIVSEIGFIGTNHSVGDGMTKIMNQAQIRNAISSGNLTIHAEQWTKRQ